MKTIERIIKMLSTVAALITAIVGVLEVIKEMVPSQEKKEDGK